MARRSWRAAIGSWFGTRHAIPTMDAMGSSDDMRGDNGLYGGQGQPCLFFCLTLGMVVILSPSTSDNTESNANVVESSLQIYGVFLRLVGAAFTIAFTSLRMQILGLAGSRGLYPASSMLHQARVDMPSLFPRCALLPALWLWASSSDVALCRTCEAGICMSLSVVYGGSGSPVGLFAAWVTWVVLTTACPLLQYPWDCLLSETGFVCATLLPPLLPLHSKSVAVVALPTWPAIWALRLLLARVMFGMGKFKFSTRWNHPDHSLYLKYFMSWQPLPTPLAWLLVAVVPDSAWVVLHYAMWFVEVPLPALYFSPSLLVRGPSAIVTILLQVAIQVAGNYGLFNVLVAVLALPLLAPACDSSASRPAPDPVDVVVFAFIALLGLIELPHNSYTTNAWLYLVPTHEIPPQFRHAVEAFLAVLRVIKPLHIAHGYGVFTPLALRNCTDTRLVLRIYAKDTADAKEWRAVPTRANSNHATGRLQFFAPHQPRLDHQLFYEGFEIDLAETSGTNPYFTTAAALLPRLAHRLLEGEPSVIALLGVGAMPNGPPAELVMRREWVRFATWAERARTGAWWVDCDHPYTGGRTIVDHFVRPPQDEQAGGEESTVVRVLPLGEQLNLRGYWGDRSRDIMLERHVERSAAAHSVRERAKGD